MSVVNWVEIPIPQELSPGPGSQILHYFRIDDRWAVYMMEICVDEEDENSMMMPHMGHSINGLVKWHITFDSNVVAQGHLEDVGAAKNVSMTVLEALMAGPEPKTAKGIGNMIGGPVN